MERQGKKEKEIELVFPPTAIEDVNNLVRKGPGEKVLEQFSASIEDIASWFKQYQVELIEVWINGGIQTEGLIKLAISAKGEGGLKLTLKPKA